MGLKRKWEGPRSAITDGAVAQSSLPDATSFKGVCWEGVLCISSSTAPSVLFVQDLLLQTSTVSTSPSNVPLFASTLCCTLACFDLLPSYVGGAVTAMFQTEE